MIRVCVQTVAPMIGGQTLETFYYARANTIGGKRPRRRLFQTPAAAAAGDPDSASRPRGSHGPARPRQPRQTFVGRPRPATPRRPRPNRCAANRRPGPAAAPGVPHPVRRCRGGGLKQSRPSSCATARAPWPARFGLPIGGARVSFRRAPWLSPRPPPRRVERSGAAQLARCDVILLYTSRRFSLLGAQASACNRVGLVLVFLGGGVRRESGRLPRLPVRVQPALGSSERVCEVKKWEFSWIHNRSVADLNPS
jgi:hypothetical protein